MNRKFAAAAVAALAVIGACSRSDNAAYDSAAGATTGAMATPPATTPGVGLSTGASTGVGLSTGATTAVIDTTVKTTKKP